MVELRATWEGIRMARFLLADSLIVEGDSSTVIAWLRGAVSSPSWHPILYDVATMLRGCSSLTIKHVFREVNSAADWVASFGAQQDVSVWWFGELEVPVPL